LLAAFFIVPQPVAALRRLPSCPTRRSSDLRAGGINRVEAVLLQEVLTQDAPDFDDEPFVVLKCVWTDQLNDFLQVAFALQHVYRSAEHTSELQSRLVLVCRLLLAKTDDHII